MFSHQFSIRSLCCKVTFALGLLVPCAGLLGEPWDLFSGDKTPENPFVAVAEKLRPAVVSISVRKAQDARAFEYYDDPERGSMKRPRSGLLQFGSGLIISSDGLILTNNHVVDEASSIRVTVADNSEFNARIVGQDPETDVAVIRLDMDRRLEGNALAPLGDSEAVKVGEWVVAIGNPFGFQRTVSVGVVSGKGRVLEEIEGGSPPFQDFIQTDASINPGNSGGPLANLRGEVIGINTAYRSTGSGVGFAIPINLASRVADQLRDTGRVVRGFLGVHPQAMTPDLADACGVAPGGGILVGDVQSGSPAHKGGLRRGDVIQEVGGHQVRDVASYRRLIAEAKPGSEVSIRILRGGAQKTVTCVVQLRTPLPKVMQKNEELEGLPGLPGTRAWMGLIVHDRGMIEARRANDQANEGVVVTYVAPSSASEEKGVGIGDEILEIEGIKVSTVTDYHPLSKRFERQDKPVLFLLRRKGEKVTAFVALREKN